MDQRILNFLSKNRVCCLAILLPDGTPHVSALHYSHKDKPLTLLFSTENVSKKCQGLLNGKAAKASCVVGFSEEDWITFQMDGEVRAIFDPTELKEAKDIHYTKHPDSKQYENNPETLFLSFTPSWWRYSDYNTDPLTILASDL